MIKKLNKEANIPSADTISNRIFKIFSNEQANLQKKFKKFLVKFHLLLIVEYLKIKDLIWE